MNPKIAALWDIRGASCRKELRNCPQEQKLRCKQEQIQFKCRWLCPCRIHGDTLRDPRWGWLCFWRLILNKPLWFRVQVKWHGKVQILTSYWTPTLRVWLPLLNSCSVSPLFIPAKHQNEMILKEERLIWAHELRGCGQLESFLSGLEWGRILGLKDFVNITTAGGKEIKSSETKKVFFKAFPPPPMSPPPPTFSHLLVVLRNPPRE